MDVVVRMREGMRRTRGIAPLLLLFPIATALPAFGGPFEDAAAAVERGDYPTAYRLLTPLAREGIPEAQFNLGLMYFKGEGVPRDPVEAAMWYRKAAEQGNAPAQYNLGLLYDTGKGVPRDYAEAAKWYRRAAGQGDPDAQFNLGVMYTRGEGVPQDYVLAHMWYNLAASRYPASRPESREESIQGRDLLASRMTADQIAEAQRLAREWKPAKED